MIMSNGMDFNVDGPRDLHHLKELVGRFSISAKVDNYDWVTVENGIGNAQYLAKSGAELAWLQANSDEIDYGGYLTKYHIIYR